MPTNEKEINNYLFDQLANVERIEEALEESPENAKKEINRIKKEINRKLYQNPGSKEENQ